MDNDNNDDDDIINNMIYGLIDPRTKEIRYIGLSSRGLKRPSEHLTAGLYNAEKTWEFPVYKWIRKLVELGLMPNIIVLEYVDKAEDLFEIEREWIAAWRAMGFPLLNMTDGGEGTLGYKYTPEQIERMSNSRRGRKASEAHRENISRALTGRAFSEEHLENMRIAQLGKKASDEARENMSLAQRARALNPETRVGPRTPEHNANHSAAMKEYWASLSPEEKEQKNFFRPGHEMSEETKKKISESVTLARATPQSEEKKRIKQLKIDNGVECLVCNKKMSIITNTHLRKHGMTPDEYLKIPGAVLCSDMAKETLEKTRYRAAPITKKCEFEGCNNTVNNKNSKFCSYSCNSKNNQKNNPTLKTGTSPAVIIRKKDNNTIE